MRKQCKFLVSRIAIARLKLLSQFETVISKKENPTKSIPNHNKAKSVLHKTPLEIRLSKTFVALSD